MDTQISEIGISYQTIKVTKGRIGKGLLAIPVSLIDKFPQDNIEISIYFDNETTPQKKAISPLQKA